MATTSLIQPAARIPFRRKLFFLGRGLADRFRGIREGEMWQVGDDGLVPVVVGQQLLHGRVVEFGDVEGEHREVL